MQNTSGLSKRAQQKVALWKNRLLDLSNQNRQLFFQPTNKETIAIVHPDVPTLFKILVELGQTCSFPPIYKRPKSGKKQGSSSANSSSDNEEEEQGGSSWQEAFEKRRSSLLLTELVTKFEDGALRTRLNGLQQKATELEEEKGFNPLFLVIGLLKWYDPSQKAYNLSPLLFLNIKLSLETPQSPYKISVLDDDVIVNPHLREKIRTTFNLELPRFDEEIQMYSLRNFISELKSIIPDTWEYLEESYLSIFSSTKIAFFNDMEEYADRYYSHPIVKALAEEQGYTEAPECIPSAEEMSDDANPWDSYSVVDCDSSQMEAIFFAKKGSSLVIQGPPGTGKSQCITNIIAECVGLGKKILFVAEKKAAIEVVFQRLQKCGLGEFCLDIHSSAPKKADLMDAIARTITIEYNNPPVRPTKHTELLLLRQRLNEYVAYMNEPQGRSNLSLFEIIGRDLSFQAIPLLNVPFPDPYEYSEIDLVKIDDIFNRLEPFRTAIEHHADHPWAAANLQTLISTNPASGSIPSTQLNEEDIKLRIKSGLGEFIQLTEQMHREIHEVKTEILKIPQPTQTSAIAGDASDLANKGQKGDNYWLVQFKRVQYWHTAWRLYPLWQKYRPLLLEFAPIFNLHNPNRQFLSFDYVQQHIKLLSQESLEFFVQTRLNRLMQTLPQMDEELRRFNVKYPLHSIHNAQELGIYQEFLNEYSPRALLLDSTRLIPLFEEKYKSMMSRMGGTYQKDKAQILACLRETTPKRELNDHLYRIREFQDFIGTNVDPLIIDEMDFHIKHLGQLMQEIGTLLKDLENLLPIEPLLLDSNPHYWQENLDTARGWLGVIDQFNEWYALLEIREQLNTYKLSPFFDALCDKSFPNITYQQLFRKKFTRELLSKALILHPTIENFDSAAHTKNIAEFGSMDQEILRINQERLRQYLFANRPDNQAGIDPAMNAQMGFLKREVRKKKNIKSLRYLFSSARDYLVKLKPCLMMSPLSVANFLDLKEYTNYFDLVIFDEASQVNTEDALGAIVRGKQLIVVGDSQQLPPTQFFLTKADDGNADENLDLTPMESLLEECTGIGFREKLLRYHYRSRREGLIAFSNAYFYGGRLYTFPDLQRVGIQPPPGIKITPAVEFCYCQNGVFENRRNLAEAQMVARAIIDHFQTNQQNKTNFSLGVVAFSQAQQEAIGHELDGFYRQNPAIEQSIKDFGHEPLFIRNLENVQGDERDVIFISVGYGRNPVGHLGMHFGPINQAGGYRRLNVIITRARMQIKLFASFLPGEINPAKIQSEGLRRLVDYMEFARSQRISSPGENNSENQGLSHIFEFPFEKDVINSLQAAGLQVESRIGQSTFKIDIAIVDPTNPAKYSVAIICDGGSYGQTPWARDRDRIRPQVLRGLGWKVFHIRAPDWRANRNEIIRQIKDLCLTPIAIPIETPIPNPELEFHMNPERLGTDDTRVDHPSTVSDAEKAGINSENIPEITAIDNKLNQFDITIFEDRSRLLNQPGISTYIPFSVSQPISQGIFFADTAAPRMDAIRKILDQEGPLHLDLFTKRVMNLFDFKRTSPKIAEKLQEIQNSLFVHEEFVSLGTQTNPGIRICLDPANDPRNFAQIHPLELQNAILWILQRIPRLKKTDLFAFTLKIFGLNSLRKAMIPRLDGLLESLVNQGLVYLLGNFVSTNPSGE
jgi:superfamily I DNA and/or RNA helicase